MAETAKVGHPKRGEIYLVSFDPTIGAEIKKTRPALVLQNDIANRFSPITIVAAVTSRVSGELYPTEVLVRAPEGGLQVDSLVLLNQIRSIDTERLVRRMGTLPRRTMDRVDKALMVSVGLVDIDNE
jgi:mRNA interferase MazF